MHVFPKGVNLGFNQATPLFGCQLWFYYGFEATIRHLGLHEGPLPACRRVSYVACVSADELSRLSYIYMQFHSFR